MGLSSNILWHQTNKNGFYSILKTKKLLYSYSLERVVPAFKMDPIAFPMISMCDYPFSEIGNNKWTYGNYCIGFKRSWGEKVGFSPVWYCSIGSRGLRQLDVLLEEGIKKESKGIFGVAMFLFAHIKFDQAPLKVNKRIFNKYRFYDEREWRIVPYITETDSAELYPFLTESGYKEYKQTHNGNSHLGIGVEFDYDDINYIIVENEEDVHCTREIVGERIHVFTKNEVVEDVIGVGHHEEIIPSPEQQDFEAAKRHIERIGSMLIEGLKKRKKGNN